MRIKTLKIISVIEIILIIVIIITLKKSLDYAVDITLHDLTSKWIGESNIFSKKTLPVMINEIASLLLFIVIIIRFILIKFKYKIILAVSIILPILTYSIYLHDSSNMLISGITIIVFLASIVGVIYSHKLE